MSDRREFLKNAAVATAGVLLGACDLRDASANPPQSTGRAKRREIFVGRRRLKTVDIHSHCFPDIRDLLKGHEEEAKENNGFLNPHRRFTMLEPDKIADRLQNMDEHGIDVQAVSLFSGYNYWADRDLAARLAQRQNEQLFALCTAHPDRFVGLGPVSLKHPDLTLQQMEEGVTKYGFRGFVIGATVNGEELSAPKFNPFWAKAEELGIVIFIHPVGFPEAGKRFQGNGGLGNIIGNPLETTVALSHLIFEGTLDRYPGVKIVAAHGGGYLPSYLGRSNHCAEKIPTVCKPVKKLPGEYFKEQIYCDTVVYSSEGLRHLVAEVGANHVVYGTDFPASVNEPVSANEPFQRDLAGNQYDLQPLFGEDLQADFVLNSGLSTADKRAILGENAAKILRIGA
jgi:aminocarboxymuconate-semialdehyde decarboxylase